MLEAFASGFLVFCFFASALFFLAITFGAPVADYAFSGAKNNQPAIWERLVGAVFFLMLFAMAGHYLAQLGLMPQLLDQTANSWANWAMVAICLLAAISNYVTSNKKRKKLWGSVTVAMTIAALLVAL